MDGPSVRTVSSRETWARSSQTGKRKAQWSKINNPIRKFSYFRVFFMNFSITNLVIQQPKTWKWYIFQKLSTTRIADIYRLYTLQKKKSLFCNIYEWNFYIWITVKGWPWPFQKARSGLRRRPKKAVQPAAQAAQSSHQCGLARPAGDRKTWARHQWEREERSTVWRHFLQPTY